MSYVKKWLLLFTVFVSCKPHAEFYKNGKGYYTVPHCTKSHIETTYGYHYGLNPTNAQYEWHNGFHTETICDESTIDTLQIQ